MKPIKAGIVGTGFSAIAHIEALRRVPGTLVWGIAGRERAKSEQVAADMGIPRVYDDYMAMIDDPEIEVIHNCTPNALHYEINKQALLAGKHILSEKPLAVTSQESQELAELAEQVNVRSGVCFNYRHYPMVSEAREFLRQQENGDVFHVQGSYLQDWLLYESDYSWRLDPELNGPSRAMADIGSHWCDTVQHVLGKRIVEVCADLKTAHMHRQRPLVQSATFESAEGECEEVAVSSEDYGSVLIRFEDGVQGVFSVSQVAAGRKNRLVFEIAAGQAAVAWDQERPNELWVGRRGQANEVVLKDPETLSKRSARLAHYPGGHQEGWPDGLKNLCGDFYAHVREPKHNRSYATFAQGHQLMLLIEAILCSHEDRRWVTLLKE